LVYDLRENGGMQKFFTVKGEEVRVRVKVRPGSDANSVVGVRGGELVVKVKARAEKGRANRELVAFLAAWARLPKKDVVILSGDHSRRKTVSLPLAAAGILREIAS
jgi:uncharacterized protein (TIGR00251 family)